MQPEVAINALLFPNSSFCSSDIASFTSCGTEQKRRNSSVVGDENRTHAQLRNPQSGREGLDLEQCECVTHAHASVCDISRRTSLASSASFRRCFTSAGRAAQPSRRSAHHHVSRRATVDAQITHSRVREDLPDACANDEASGRVASNSAPESLNCCMPASKNRSSWPCATRGQTLI